MSASIDRELRRERFPGFVVLRILARLTGWPTLAGIAVLVVVGAVVPNAMTLSLGWLASSAERAFAGESTSIVWPLVAVGLTFLVSSALGPVLEVVGRALGTTFETKLRDEAMAAASSVAGIAHLEDPRNTDRLVAAEDLSQGWLIPRSPQGLIESWTGRLRGTLAGAILWTFAWWAPLVVFAAYRLSRAYSLKTGMLYLRRHVTNTQPLRRAAYVRSLLHGGQAAKEVRVFGISDWLVDRFRGSFREGMDEIWRDRNQVPLMGAPISLVSAAAIGWVCYRIGVAGAVEGLAIGSVVVYIQSVFGMSGFLAQGDPEWQMHFGAFRAKDAQRLRETVRTEASDLRGDVVPGPLSNSLRFEDVRFTYPAEDREILRGVSFEVPAGTSLAIVGENGAGKTTSIKLLSRLYDPTSGRILVDGVDLKTIDPAAWRRQVGVIFQDFIRYDLTARENVGYGALSRIADDDALHRAAKLAGADTFLDRIGWDVPLSRRYEGGADLSGGEWQRIALARALLAIEGGARLLILDEPTANLDVRAEAAIYERFLEMTRGVTTILISHRFSTVRLADKIVVIEGGVVVESGTHDELLARAGRYAAMFLAQASAYGDVEAGEALDA